MEAQEKHGPESSKNVHLLRQIECDQMAEMVRRGDGEFIQLGAGRSWGNMLRIDLEGLDVLLADVPNRTAVHGSGNADLEVFSIPLRWKGENRWNGVVVDTPTVIGWGNACEFSRVATDAVIATLIFDRAIFLARYSDWAGPEAVPYEVITGNLFDTSPATMGIIHAVQGAISFAEKTPSLFDLEHRRTAIRDSILLAIFEALPESHFPVKGAMKSRSARREIVARTDDYLRTHGDGEVSLFDLCSVTGVSSRSLEYAFREIIGVSPFQYIKLRRLRRARALLREGDPGLIKVGQCARTAGFSHLGRFSVEYRKFFGESPSTTLGT